MRRLSAALVALTAAVALSALSAPAWAAPAKPKAKPKPTPIKERPLVVAPSQVKSGQSVKVSGGGCQKASALSLMVDNREFHRRTAKSGDWSYQVQLPSGLRYGDHDMTAQCKGVKHKPARFHVSRDRKPRGSFSVSPDTVIAGDKVWADGNGCRRHSPVYITLGNRVIKRTFADRYGNFDKKVQIPRNAKGRQVVSAWCGKHKLGSDGIKVKPTYKQKRDKVYFDHNVVKPGKKMRVRADDCYGKPVAYFNDRPIAMNGVSDEQGYTGEVTIPRGTPAGKYKFAAGCEDGSYGSTDLDVMDEEDFYDAADRGTLGTQRSSDLAMWAGLFVGLALLVASTLITTRRRRSHR